MADVKASSPRIRGSKLDIDYTDVVVIGNGPSGICLSYLLSGNWPYYTGAPHPNEYLQLRLQDDIEKSLVQQDLEYLSSGLEGRSSNPVALLLDALTHPDADMGMETQSILRWESDSQRHLPHVVLGKAGIGGAWQMMEGSMQTLSLGNWMQLPDLPFKEWLRKKRRQEAEAGERPVHHQNRANIQEVKLYYEDYVKVKGLEGHFRPYTTVTSVERVLDVCHPIDVESGEQTPCARDHCGKFKWEIRGYETLSSDASAASTEAWNDTGLGSIRHFCYRAPNVVLATGCFDLPNRLGVQGDHLPYVLYSFSELESLLRTDQLTADSDPIMIVGAGLSAADAVLLAQSHGVPVVHLFRRDVEDPSLVLRKLPKMLYPEYHSVLRMMEQGGEHYTPYPMHSVIELMADGKVLIRRGYKKTDGGCGDGLGDLDNSGGDVIVQTSYVIVLIGSRPDLSYLPHEGKHLGVVPDVRIDSKHNPIDIDSISHQSVHETGLFAMGPLVGDNFVRFLRGGALGITAHIWRKRDQAM